MNEADWEQRVADAWASIDQRSEAEFLALIEQLATELPADSGIGSFERAASLDSTGHPDLAVPLYRKALDHGLTGERRRRAVIQLASSLRNLGQSQESVALLTTELGTGPTTWTTRSGPFLHWPWWTLGESGRRSHSRSPHWLRTYPGTSVRWPPTPDCSWMASPDRYRGTLSKLVDRSTVQASRALDLMTRQADTQDPIGISVRDGEHRHLVRAEEVTDAGTLAEVTGAYATKYAGSPFVRPLLGEPAVNATLRLDPA